MLLLGRKWIVLAALCSLGFLSACPNGSSSERTVTNDLTITSLDVSPSAFAVGYPITVSVTITTENDIDYVDVAVGLMEALPALATDVEKSTARSCALGYVRVEEIKANQATTGSNQFIINEDCLSPSAPEALLAQSSGDSNITYNIWTFVDPQERIIETTLDAEANNASVFSEANKEFANNLKCSSESTSDVGCIFDVVVQSNPGIDLLLDSFSLESSILVLYDGDDDANVASGDNEYNYPHVEADVAVQIRGPATDEENGLPDDTELVFDICPDSGDGESCATSDWMDLTIYANKDEPDGHDLVIPVDKLSSGADRYYSAGLYAEGDTLTAMQAGGVWASFDSFIVRACINIARDGFTPLAEESPNPDVDPTSNNCLFQTVMVALPSSSSSASTLLAQTTGSSSLSFSRDDSHTWGSSSSLDLTVDFGTDNSLNFSGAHSMSDASVKIGGWVSATLIDISADANALVSIVDSNVDLKVQAFSATLFNYSKVIPELDYDKNWDVSKEICGTFSYGIYILSLDVSVCVTGTLGFEAGLTISAVDGAGTGVFANSAKVGSVDPIVRPYLDFDGSVTADVNIEVAKGGVEADITILDMSLPLTGFLRWGLNSSSELVIEADIELDADFTSLQGDLVAFADVRDIKWCKKWFIHYPCGFDWDRVASVTIVSWSGEDLKYTLLNRTANTTLVQ